MLAPLTTILIVLLAVLALYEAYLTIRGRQIDDPLLYLAGATELAVIAQLVVGITRVSAASPQMSKALFIAYLVGLIFVLPIAGFWAIAERASRWGTGVLLVATLGLLVMVFRLLQLWTGHA